MNIFPSPLSKQLVGNLRATEFLKVGLLALVSGGMATLRNSIRDTPNGVFLRETLGFNI